MKELREIRSKAKGKRQEMMGIKRKLKGKRKVRKEHEGIEGYQTQNERQMKRILERENERI